VRGLLSMREREVLRLIERAAKEEEIVAQLGIPKASEHKRRKKPPGGPPPSAAAIVT